MRIPVRDGRLDEYRRPAPEAGAGPALADAPPQAEGVERADPDPEGIAAAREERLVAQLKQLSADFDNYRRRTKADLAAARARGRDQFLTELLPVLVDLGAACAPGPEEACAAGLLRGLRLLEEKLYETIAGLGYARVATVGESLDPTRHDALLAVGAGDLPPRTVVQELAPGFERDGRVVVPAKVAVTRA